MDAMGTQTYLAPAIRDGGGDYCMSLKKNWPAEHAEVERLFTHPQTRCDVRNARHRGRDGSQANPARGGTSTIWKPSSVRPLMFE
jgi:hypothetical protein